jgi:hypothetical protein
MLKLYRGGEKAAKVCKSKEEAKNRIFFFLYWEPTGGMGPFCEFI